MLATIGVALYNRLIKTKSKMWVYTCLEVLHGVPVMLQEDDSVS